MVVEKGKAEMVCSKLSNHHAALVEVERAVCHPWVIGSCELPARLLMRQKCSVRGLMTQWAPTLVLEVAPARLVSDHGLPPY